MFCFKGMTDLEMIRWREKVRIKTLEGKRHEVEAEVQEYIAYLKNFPWD